MQDNSLKSAKAMQAELTQSRADGKLAYPLARPARMRRHHWGVVSSFLSMVLVLLLATILYLVLLAEDQYASITGFTVRSQDSSGANDLLGGLVSFTGTSAASDSDILYEFILPNTFWIWCKVPDFE